MPTVRFTRPRSFLALLLLCLLLGFVGAGALSGRVVKVVDGDTVYVLDASNSQHKIRLSGIDAPERGQPFGMKAKEYLSGLVAGKDVRVEWYKRDRYRRIVGTCRNQRIAVGGVFGGNVEGVIAW